MLRMTYRTSVALLVLALFSANAWFSQPVHAQISQSNAATISGSVNDATGKPVIGATVSLRGPKVASMQTDTHGLFVFVGMPIGTYAVSVTSNFGTVQRDISVENDTNVAIAYEQSAALKTIATVSTNARFNVTPASITHVDPMQLAMEGQTSWHKVIEQIPGVTVAGNSNGKVPFSTMPDSPISPVYVSINGGLPYETATLLDDMPLVGGGSLQGNGGPGSGTDLSMYPLNGFSGADVVRGPGAGAPSIIDSIGGSFVMHMPGTVNANRYAFSVTNDAYGGWIVNTQAAVRWKKLSAVATFGFNNSPGPITGNAIGTGNGFFTIDGKYFTQYFPACPSGLSCTTSGGLYVPGYAGNVAVGPLVILAGTSYGFLSGITSCCLNVNSPWSSHSGSLALTYAVSPSLTAQMSYAGQHADGVTCNALSDIFFSPPGGYIGAISPGSYILPAVSGAFTVATTTSSLLEEKITAHVGKGILKVAALQNRNYSSTVQSPITATQQLYGAGNVCSNTSSFCSGGTSTLTIFNGDMHTVGFLPQVSTVMNSAIDRDQLLSYETPIGSVYAGASFVQSYSSAPYSQSILCLPPLTPAPTVGLAIALPSAITQTTREFRLFMGGNPSQRTTLDLSMYFVHSNYHVPDPNDPNSRLYQTPGANFSYTDLGYSYAAPRIGFTWRPTAQIAVRASAGGGFAQAPLYDMSHGASKPLYTPSILAYKANGTNFNLQPEKSFAFDLGTDIRLQHNTLLSFDVFQANLTGQLYSESIIEGTYNDGVHGTLPLYVNQFVNLAASRYAGLSVTLSRNVPLGFSWALSGGLTRGYVVSVPPGFYNANITGTPACNFTTGANCANLNVVPGVNFNGTVSVGAAGGAGAASVPYAQAQGSLTYTWNKGRSAGLNLEYYGNNNAYYRPPFITLDGNITYPVTSRISLAVNFRNITGIYGGGVQALGPGNFIGASSLAGPPYPLYGGQVGPRTVQFTVSGSL